MTTDDFEAMCIHTSNTLLDALGAVDRGSVGLALVVDEQRRLVGLVTDGDVRRALLAGALLQDEVGAHANRHFSAVHGDASRAQVLELMQARRLTQMPIVGEDRELLGLHTLHEVIGRQVRDNWAVVMAGGRGTRLGALTDSLPKPMIRVAGRPILERIVLQLVEHGVRRVFLAVHYLANVVEDHFGDGRTLGCRIEYLREEKPLGTAGALSLLPEGPVAPVLVMNGDLVTEAHLGDLIDYHEDGHQAATVGVKTYVHQVPFGCLDLDGDRVVRLAEKPVLTQTINSGIYVLSPDVVGLVPTGEVFQMPELIERCLAEDRVVHAHEIASDWLDVGRREQLVRARGEE